MSSIPKDLLGTVQGGRVIDVATGGGDYVSTLVDALGSWTEIVGIDADPAYAGAFVRHSPTPPLFASR